MSVWTAKLAIIRKGSQSEEQQVKYGNIQMAAQTVGVSAGEIAQTLEKGFAWQNKKWEINIVRDIS